MNTTERLILPTARETVLVKELVPQDADAMFASIEQSREHLTKFAQAVSDEFPTRRSVWHSIAALSDRGPTRFGIWDLQDPSQETFVGSITIQPKDAIGMLHYWIDSHHLRQGYGSLAAGAVTKHHAPFFEKIVAEVDPGNDISQRVLSKAGFVLAPALADGFLQFEYFREPQQLTLDVDGPPLS